ncbi:hypothetical protein QUA13_01955 [Microcoleus sp. S28C3]|uniref:hypothetical protein n=1 Tax=Microcoleus sp. S28C3 TaxID=3055414 RepID=UPI002FCE7E42
MKNHTTYIPHPKVSHHAFWSIDDLGASAGQEILSMFSDLIYQPKRPIYDKTSTSQLRVRNVGCKESATG